MKRGWVGRIDGDHVIHLAAQTLQAFFTGGGSAREHAVYPLAGVRLLAPVLHPPSVRVFSSETSFEFANPAAIIGPEATVAKNPRTDRSQEDLTLLPRLAAIVGANGGIGGFTLAADWRHTGQPPPKDRDFAFGLGPLVVTPDECDPNGLGAIVRVDGMDRLPVSFEGFDWTAARDFAADGTVLRPGDLLAGPTPGTVEDVRPGSTVELAADGIGVLSHTVLRD
jgi:hypothetical protein